MSVMFETPRQIQAKISLGTFLVWIGIIATAAGSALYWGTTTQVFDAKYMATQGNMSTMALYGMLLLAFVIEAYKKATLGGFRNRRLWYWLVFASVLTSVGGTMIINQSRENTLNTSTASYSSSVASLEDAKAKRSLYARCKDFSMADLDKKLSDNDANVPRKANGKKDWGKFGRIKSQIAKDKQCLSSYQNADAAVVIAEADLTNASTGNVAVAGSSGSATSSNPLMYTIHTMIGVAEATLVMLFYILVTVLVEAVTYFIGGEVEKMKRQKILTANEIMIINVHETMGIDLSAKQDAIVDKGVDMEMQHQLDTEKKKLLFKIKRQEMLNELDRMQRDVDSQIIDLTANNPTNNTSSVDHDMTGMTHIQLVERRDKYKAMPVGQRLCPYCSTKVPVSTGTYYCDSSHQTQFNNTLKALSRAGAGSTV